MVPRSHFMHQGHALVQNVNTRGYLCGGCKTHGIGTNSGCEPCSFHMHDFCSNCPRILSSFLHPEHPLSLMISNNLYTASPICDVCGDTVEGLFYWCQNCEFNVHPLCTQFPQSLRHAVHYPHHLMFQKSYKDAPCCVCGCVCNSWRYRCGYCDGYDVHFDCVAEPDDAKSSDTTTRRLPPSAGLYTYGGVNSTANSYNMYKPPCANDQTTPPYDQYNPYVGDPSGVYTYSMSNSYGVIPHGTYAYQPNNPYGEMPIGTNSHNMCYSYPGSASGTYQNGMPPNIHSYNMHSPNSYNMYHYPLIGLPCYTNPCTMYNPQNGAPFDMIPQHVQNHHGHPSYQAPAHNAQTNPAQGQGSGKLGRKIFGIVSTLTLGVISNVIFGAIF